MTGPTAKRVRHLLHEIRVVGWLVELSATDGTKTEVELKRADLPDPVLELLDILAAEAKEP